MVGPLKRGGGSTKQMTPFFIKGKTDEKKNKPLKSGGATSRPLKTRIIYVFPYFFVFNDRRGNEVSLYRSMVFYEMDR